MEPEIEIDLQLNQSDKVVELLGWFAIFGIWCLTLFTYFEVTGLLSSNYKSGIATYKFDNTVNLFALSIISTLFFIVLTFLNKKPHILNYSSKITVENALYKYTNAARMIRFSKLIVVFSFGVAVLNIIKKVHINVDILEVWFLPLTMMFIFITTINAFIKRNKAT
jgi:hypothetical protein